MADIEEAQASKPKGEAWTIDMNSASESSNAKAASGVDWASLKATLPVSKTSEDGAKRKELWKKFNGPNPNSLALFELDAAILKVLGCEELFNAKPVINKAYIYAREINPKGSMEAIEFVEFRLLLVYLKGLFDIYQVFTSLDTSKDSRLQLSELQAAQPGLAAVGVKIEDPHALWEQLKGTSDTVDFDTFADWAIRKNLGGTELSDLIDKKDSENQTRGEETNCEKVKEAFKGSKLCKDGAISVDNFKAVLSLLDKSWTEQHFQHLSELPGLTVTEGQVSVDQLIDFLFSR